MGVVCVYPVPFEVNTCSLWAAAQGAVINYYRIDFHLLRLVVLLHGNIIFMQINTARFIKSSAHVDQVPEGDRPEFAFIGRSNVGKSSLINMLVGQKSLAKVSGTPGKTILINHFLINGGNQDKEGWYLVDLPGYGYAKRSQDQRKAWKKMILEYFEQRESLMCVFVLIDSRISPQKTDLEFIAVLGEKGIPFNLVFTKADKNSQAETAKNVRSFIQEMKKEWEEVPAHFVTSAEKGLGKKQLLEYIGAVILSV